MRRGTVMAKSVHTRRAVKVFARMATVRAAIGQSENSAARRNLVVVRRTDYLDATLERAKAGALRHELSGTGVGVCHSSESAPHRFK